MPRKTATATTAMNVEDVDNSKNTTVSEKKSKKTQQQEASASNRVDDNESSSSSSDAEESADEGEGEGEEEKNEVIAFFEACSGGQDSIFDHLKKSKTDWANKDIQKACLKYLGKLEQFKAEIMKQLLANQKKIRAESKRKGLQIVQNPKPVHSEVIKILGLSTDSMTHRELMNAIKNVHDSEADSFTTTKKGKDGKDKSETKISKTIKNNGKISRLLQFIQSRNDEGLQSYLNKKEIMENGSMIQDIEYTQFNCLAKVSFAEFKK